MSISCPLRQVLGFFQRAWNQFTVAVEVNPKNWAAYEGRAVTSLQMDNMFAALQDINCAIKVVLENDFFLYVFIFLALL